MQYREIITKLKSHANPDNAPEWPDSPLLSNIENPKSKIETSSPTFSFDMGVSFIKICSAVFANLFDWL